MFGHSGILRHVTHANCQFRILDPSALSGQTDGALNVGLMVSRAKPSQRGQGTSRLAVDQVRWS
jgi:hypothetical protein